MTFSHAWLLLWIYCLTLLYVITWDDTCLCSNEVWVLIYELVMGVSFKFILNSILMFLTPNFSQPPRQTTTLFPLFFLISLDPIFSSLTFYSEGTTLFLDSVISQISFFNLSITLSINPSFELACTAIYRDNWLTDISKLFIEAYLFVSISSGNDFSCGGIWVTCGISSLWLHLKFGWLFQHALNY